jgi:(heptosyl)LPS beta-1,4-glucosyltransferase
MKLPVSVIIITKNEEKNIAACLECVSWADDIIVIDSFSDDQTVPIALQYTSRVIQRSWPGMVGTQRNIGLELAAHDWLLFLDADERVTEALRDEICRLIKSDDADIFGGGEIPRKNFFFGRWIRSSYPNYTRRFLKRGKGRYNEIPGKGFDALVVDQGDIHRFRHPLLHFTGETLAQRVRKLDFDSGLQAGEKFRAGQRAGWKELLLNPAHAFMRLYLFKGGIRDGIPGFIYACLHSFSTFMKYAKLWELTDEQEPVYRKPPHA